MTDVLSKEQRAYNMSKIRGKNTGPEMKLRKLLWSAGIRGYRVHYDLPGKPDIVFVKKKIVLFIDGCFWHKCPIDFQEPETRKDFWMKKINSNVERDERINRELSDTGWTIIRIWEHEMRKEPEKVVQRIVEIL
jgi:DNA mismatch endonuclease, patch repair protein